MRFADSFYKDPRIEEAKTLIMSALEEHQSKITEVHPPLEELKISYEEAISTFSYYRGGNLYYPYLGSGFGNGVFVELLDGSVKYDFITGIGVHYMGHSSKILMSSNLHAALSDTVMQGNLQQNQDSFELTKLLIKTSGLKHCFLTTSGVMAVENGLKMIFQKKHPRDRLLAFSNCFAGRTLTVSQITDNAAYRQGLPLNQPVDYIPFFEYDDPEGSTKRAVDALKEHISRYPNRHAGMIFELVQGEAGFYPGNHTFFVSLMEILKENEIAILVDEVQTFGRTTELYAFRHFNLEKYVDVVTIGKMSQVCATLFQDEYQPKPGLISQTFTASTSAIQASLAILSHITENHFFGKEGKVEKTHKYFEEKLTALSDKHPDKLTGPYGIGGMVAFTVFDGDPKKTVQFIKTLFDNGVIAFIAGTNPTRVRFLAPMGPITFRDIDNVCKIVDLTLLTLSN